MTSAPGEAPPSRGAVMLTAGVDLAAEPARTALAVIEWSPGRARLEHLSVGVRDEEIVDAARDVARIGIDCALGWPEEFVAFVSAHADSERAPSVDGGADWRRRLAYRETDRRVHERTGRWPLSVSTDRLGLTAMRCAGLVGRLAASRLVVDRSGIDGIVAEVYPGATLRVWDIDARGYRTDAGVRRSVLDEIGRRAPWLEVGGYRDAAARSPDALDAIIAALAARAAAFGRFPHPPSELRDLARREGWIVLPDCAVEELVAHRA